MRALMLFLAAFCVLMTLGLAGGVVWAYSVLDTKNETIRSLVAEVERVRSEEAVFSQEREILLTQLTAVERERDAARQESVALKTALRDLETRMIETMVPREIQSVADFPVERAMAKDGEAVRVFAEREKTTIPVLKALNPWLDEAAALKSFQVLWIPRKRSPLADGR